MGGSRGSNVQSAVGSIQLDNTGFILSPPLQHGPGTMVMAGLTLWVCVDLFIYIIHCIWRHIMKKRASEIGRQHQKPTLANRIARARFNKLLREKKLLNIKLRWEVRET